MENKIIEAEFKEVTEDISLERLASKINIITEQANKTLLNAAIEIGKRFAAAMAPAAIDTLSAHFSDTGFKPNDYDLILTGDLGIIGSDILEELMLDEG